MEKKPSGIAKLVRRPAAPAAAPAPSVSTLAANRTAKVQPVVTKRPLAPGNNVQRPVRAPPVVARVPVKRPAPPPQPGASSMPAKVAKLANVANAAKVAKPAPYDFKAKHALLLGKHTELKAEHTTLKESFTTTAAQNSDLISKLATLQQISEERAAEAAALASSVRRLEATVVDLGGENKELKSRINNLEADLKQSQDLNSELANKVQQYHAERRLLHNTIQDLKGNIRVFCRFRPPTVAEKSQLLCTMSFPAENKVELLKNRESIEPSKLPRGKAGKLEFAFDRVFPPGSSQALVFEELSQLVQSALDGYNVCVFAYGATGSGKTYTMEGGKTEEAAGMIPRTIDLLFNAFEPLKSVGWEYEVQASFLEIYNEQVIDLLNIKKKENLDIKMKEGKVGEVYVPNLTIEKVFSAEQLRQTMVLAQRNRAVACTRCNERSSRSHFVTKIELKGCNSKTGDSWCSAINLVDLAGSERLNTEGGEARIAETKNINKSLSNLGNVILALCQRQDHVPYRNSKLTYLLMPCLGGNSKTLMMVNISPLDESFVESVNSLRFASVVNSCKLTTAKKNKA